MKKFCIIASLTLIISHNIIAQENIQKDSLISDFSYLVKLLESSHPDPYTNFGGKVFFHEQASQLKKEFADNDYSLPQFQDKVSGFLVNLHDGHTYIDMQQSSVKDLKRYLPLQMKVIPDGLLLSGLPEIHKDLLGSRVDSINGLSIDILLKRISTIRISENTFGDYANLGADLSHPNINTKLFPKPQEEISLSITTPGNKKETLVLPYIERQEWLAKQWSKIPEWEKIPDDYLSYCFLDNKKKVMLFKLTSVMARENFAFTIKNQWSGAYDELKNFYNWALKKEMPSDTIQALAGVPSLSEEFYTMLIGMKKHKSEVLIIDLRGNGGGWTPITLPVLYQLYGDRYLKTDMKTATYKLISPLLLEKQNKTLSQLSKTYGITVETGDYIPIKAAAIDTSDMPALREDFINSSMCDHRQLLEAQNGKPVYSPEKIYVLTDEWTFSAAFHFAFYLWKMGAVIAGVPSMQAPNTYMEQTPFQLPATKLSGSISNSLQLFLPVNDRRAKIFWPDIMLTYKDYANYQFDKHAEILYLSDIIK